MEVGPLKTKGHRSRCSYSGRNKKGRLIEECRRDRNTNFGYCCKVEKR